MNNELIHVESNNQSVIENQSYHFNELQEKHDEIKVCYQNLEDRYQDIKQRYDALVKDHHQVRL